MSNKAMNKSSSNKNRSNLYSRIVPKEKNSHIGTSGGKQMPKVGKSITDILPNIQRANSSFKYSHNI